MARNDINVAHNWAHQQGAKRLTGSQMYWDGDTIYSYGSHFPIARHSKEAILFTTRTASNTTAKHIRATVQAIPIYKKIINCNDIEVADNYPESTKHSDNLRQMFDELEFNLDKLSRARKKLDYIEKIKAIKDNIVSYACHFEITLTEFQQNKLCAADISSFNKEVELEREDANRKEMLMQEMAAPVRNKYWELWRKGYTNSEIMKEFDIFEQVTYRKYVKDQYDDTSRLRIVDDIIITSLNVTIPVAVAHRAWLRYNEIVLAGGCDDNCDYKILHYQVHKANSDVLVVGCHRIPRSEIDYIAQQLNWK